MVEKNNNLKRFSSNKQKDFAKSSENRQEDKYKRLNNQLELRKVKTDDLEFLYKLRNDPSVRESSFNTEPISLAIHKEWFHKKLEANHDLILIAEHGGQRIGQVRFDTDEKSNSAVVSISVRPAFRRKGFGVNILKMGCKVAFENLPISVILAIIKRENLISEKTFSKADFKRKGYSEYEGYPSIEMTLEINK